MRQEDSDFDITAHDIHLAREAHRTLFHANHATHLNADHNLHNRQSINSNPGKEDFSQLDAEFNHYSSHSDKHSSDISKHHTHHETSSNHEHQIHHEHKHPRLHAHKISLLHKFEVVTQNMHDAFDNTFEIAYNKITSAQDWLENEFLAHFQHKITQRQIRVHKEKSAKKLKDSASKKKFMAYFETAGYDQTHSEILKNLSYLSIILTIIAFGYYGYIKGEIFETVGYFLANFIVFTLAGYPVILLTVMLIAYAYTDFRIVQRKESIEKHFPEFLHVVAANIRAGMTIDQALWRGARPQFGMLSKEIEIIAKKSMIGHDLSAALRDFGRKYDSKTVRRSISLIVEGMDSGSEIGAILENVSLNLEDIELRKQSMAANVTTYVIFIVFAVLVAAPLLFAVATQLLSIVQSIGEKVTKSGSGQSTKGAGLSFSLSTDAVSQTDFFIFCIVMLVLTCTMSAIIISAIKTGKAWGAVKDMPIFIAFSLTIFIVLRWLLSTAFADII